LQEIFKILSVDTDQLDNYLTPNQSLNKKCSSITIGDRSKEDLIKYNSEICFIVESLKPYAEDDLILLDINNPDDRNKISIADFVENGARLEETWKLKEFKPHYEYFGYVSKGEDADSLVGFMCYDKQSNPNILKVSNIIWADNDNGKTQDLRNKLYDILENELTGKSLQSKLFIPAELDEKVNATLYTKGETKDGFTIWEAIMPPKPTEMEIKIKAETDPKAVAFLEFLQKLLLLFKEKVKKMVKPATDIKPAVSTDDVKIDIQTGGADNALLDEIITKYPSLKGLKSVMDDLPAEIQQKYASDITKSLEEIKESNVQETDLMDEPDFQEIQADLNAQIVEKEDKVIEEEKEKATEETPTDTPSAESKEGETSTDTPSTDATVEPPVETPSTEETPSTTDTNTSVETTVVTPTTDAAASKEPSTTNVEEPSVATVVTPTTDTVVTPTTTDTVVTPTTTDTVVTPTTDTVEPTTTTVVTPTSGTEPSNTDVTTTTTPSSSDEVTLKREDLKESPLLVQPATGESGKYIFVPKDLVEKVIDYLLNNGCEVTTVNLK